MGKIQYLLGQRGLTTLDCVYTEKVEVLVLISEEEEQRLIAEVIGLRMHRQGLNGRRIAGLLRLTGRWSYLTES